jgi:hypothetical protein
MNGTVTLIPLWFTLPAYWSSFHTKHSKRGSYTKRELVLKST